MGKEKNLSVVERFKENLFKRGFSLKKLILFGSRAREDFSEDSDFDLIVVSDEFEKAKKFGRRVMVRKDFGYDYAVDMICLTEKEFEKWKNNKQTLIGLAVSEGVEI